MRAGRSFVTKRSSVKSPFPLLLDVVGNVLHDVSQANLVLNVAEYLLGSLFQSLVKVTDENFSKIDSVLSHQSPKLREDPVEALCLLATQQTIGNWERCIELRVTVDLE
jgi:hypothetical protein